MTKYLWLLAKAGTLWVATLLAQIAGGIVTSGWTPPPASLDSLKSGPLDTVQALGVVTGLTAMALVLVSTHIRLPLLKKSLTLFAVLYGIGTLLSAVEAAYFGEFLRFTQQMVLSMSASNALMALVASVTAAVLWRSAKTRAPSAIGGLAWKVPIVVTLYVFIYFAAGYFIAWQSPAVREFYAQGLDISVPSLLLLQVGRGFVWAGLVLLCVRALLGSTLSRSIVVGTACAVFMAAPLLYPSAVMPWSVRWVHLVELAVSNFLFGVLASQILLSGKTWVATTANPRP